MVRILGRRRRRPGVLRPRPDAVAPGVEGTGVARGRLRRVLAPGGQSGHHRHGACRRLDHAVGRPQGDGRPDRPSQLVGRPQRTDRLPATSTRWCAVGPRLCRVESPHRRLVGRASGERTVGRRHGPAHRRGAGRATTAARWIPTLHGGERRIAAETCTLCGGLDARAAPVAHRRADEPGRRAPSRLGTDGSDRMASDVRRVRRHERYDTPRAGCCGSRPAAPPGVPARSPCRVDPRALAPHRRRSLLPRPRGPAATPRGGRAGIGLDRELRHRVARHGRQPRGARGVRRRARSRGRAPSGHADRPPQLRGRPGRLRRRPAVRRGGSPGRRPGRSFTATARAPPPRPLRAPKAGTRGRLARHAPRRRGAVRRRVRSLLPEPGLGLRLRARRPGRPPRLRHLVGAAGSHRSPGSRGRHAGYHADDLCGRNDPLRPHRPRPGDIRGHPHRAERSLAVLPLGTRGVHGCHRGSWVPERGGGLPSGRVPHCCHRVGVRSMRPGPGARRRARRHRPPWPAEGGKRGLVGPDLGDGPQPRGVPQIG